MTEPSRLPGSLCNPGPQISFRDVGSGESRYSDARGTSVSQAERREKHELDGAVTERAWAEE